MSVSRPQLAVLVCVWGAKLAMVSGPVAKRAPPPERMGPASMLLCFDDGPRVLLCHPPPPVLAPCSAPATKSGAGVGAEELLNSHTKALASRSQDAGKRIKALLDAKRKELQAKMSGYGRRPCPGRGAGEAVIAGDGGGGH